MPVGLDLGQFWNKWKKMGFITLQPMQANKRKEAEAKYAPTELEVAALVYSVIHFECICWSVLLLDWNEG